MKTKFWWIEVLAAAILSAAAVGQSMRVDQIAHVPFPFVVSDRTLPAGTYSLTNVGETRLRIVSSSEASVMVQIHKVQGHGPEASGRLVFHHCRNVYFLSEVWSPASDIGQQLSRSRSELELKNAETGIKTASADSEISLRSNRQLR